MGATAGYPHRLVCAGYRHDDWDDAFGQDWSMVCCSLPGSDGTLPFPVPGMSDVMPYPSSRYRDLIPQQVDAFVSAFQTAVGEQVTMFRPDILHIHHLWVLAALSTITALPSCVTVHGTDLQQARSASMHRQRVEESLRAVGHCICVSRDIEAETLDMYPVLTGRTSVLGNGFDAEVFSVRGPRVAHPHKVVLCVGKLVDWKGFRYAVRACAQVDAPHTLVVLGGGRAQDRAELQSEIDRLGIDALLLGHVGATEVARWMRAAHVFLMPSALEPFGSAFLEALACGCRSVSAAIGGPRDMVSPELVARGLAMQVRPLESSTPHEEGKYV